MKRLAMAAVGAACLNAGAFAVGQQTQAAAPAKPAMAVAHAPAAQVPAALTVDAQTALVKQYCAGCHSEKGKAGGLSLAGFDAAAVEQHADVAEKMIRKLRAGMMPPPGARRPEGTTLQDLAGVPETRIDAAAAPKPTAGRGTFQRVPT